MVKMSYLHLKLKNTLNIKESDFVFIFVGRLVGDKGVNELIEAVEENSNKVHEAADVFYHLLMYLEANDIKIEDVMSELEKRRK